MKEEYKPNILIRFILRDDFPFWFGMILLIIICMFLAITCTGIAEYICKEV